MNDGESVFVMNLSLMFNQKNFRKEKSDMPSGSDAKIEYINSDDFGNFKPAKNFTLREHMLNSEYIWSLIFDSFSKVSN